MCVCVCVWAIMGECVALQRVNYFGREEWKLQFKQKQKVADEGIGLNLNELYASWCWQAEPCISHVEHLCGLEDRCVDLLKVHTTETSESEF